MQLVPLLRGGVHVAQPHKSAMKGKKHKDKGGDGGDGGDGDDKKPSPATNNQPTDPSPTSIVDNADVELSSWDEPELESRPMGKSGSKKSLQSGASVFLTGMESSLARIKSVKDLAKAGLYKLSAVVP
jgi:hypothetical protein